MVMSGHDFCAWVSKLCALEQGGTDAEFVAALRSLAAECGVDISDADIGEWFNLDAT